MTGREEKNQLVRRYELMQQVLEIHINELVKKLSKGLEIEAECLGFQLSLRSWTETEQNRLLLAQMKELDAEVIRFKNGGISGEHFAKKLSTMGNNFLTDIVAEKCRLNHLLKLRDLLKEMQNHGESMPNVIDKHELEKFLVDC